MALRFLHACLQKGQYATKYSNVFDMKSGDIYLFPSPERYLFPFLGRYYEVKLNLTVELNKGGHYYDMPQIQDQIVQNPRPLLFNMKRFPLDDIKPIPDKEPEVTSHLRNMIKDVINGTMHNYDYTAGTWKIIMLHQKDFQTYFKNHGNFISLTLVEHSNEDNQRSYRYLMVFNKAIILQHFIFDDSNKVVLVQSEDEKYESGIRA